MSNGSISHMGSHISVSQASNTEKLFNRFFYKSERGNKGEREWKKEIAEGKREREGNEKEDTMKASKPISEIKHPTSKQETQNVFVKHKSNNLFPQSPVSWEYNVFGEVTV